jgi:lipoprotein LprG
MTTQSNPIERTLSTRARLTLPVAAAAAWLMRGSVRPAFAQDPAALLTQAAQTMAALSSFHFELTSVNGKTQFVEGIELDQVAGDVLRPLSFRADATIGMTLASITITIISIDGHAWMTDPFSSDGSFTDLGSADLGALDPTILINPDRLILPAMNTVKDPTINGAEKINDVDTTRVDGTVDLAAAIGMVAPPAAAAEEAPLSITFPESMPFSAWIDGQNQVIRVELSGPVLENEDNDIVRRIDFSAFNEPVDIQAPAQ